MANRWRNNGNSDRLIFLGSKITAGGDCNHGLKMIIPWKISYDKPRQSIKKKRHYLPTRVCLVRLLLGMWELDHNEGWVLKNWCFWTVVLEKTPESPLNFEEIQPVNPKGSQPWIFIGKTDAETEAVNTLATLCKELIHWKRPWSWERSKSGGEGDDRGWDGWMASSTQCTWVWVNLTIWCRTGKPDVLSPWGCKALYVTELLNKNIA